MLVHNMTIYKNVSLVIDIWWTYLLPAICFCSLIANLFNVVIFNKLRRVNKIYEMLFGKSITNIVYLFICFWVFLIKCGQFCSSSDETTANEDIYMGTKSFPIQLYNFYVFDFLGTILAYSDLIIEIVISAKHLVLINSFSKGEYGHTNGNKYPNSIKWLFIIIFSITIIIHSPKLFYAHVVLHEDKYRLEVIHLGMFRQLDGVMTLYLRSISMVILIVVINVSNCYHINKNFTHVEERIAFNRSRCTFVERSLLRLKRNKLILIKMLFYKSLLYICVNFFFIVGAFVYMHLDGGHSNPYFPFIQLSINTLIFISLGLN